VTTRVRQGFGEEPHLREAYYAENLGETLSLGAELLVQMLAARDGCENRGSEGVREAY
jgi:hypothetical protein